VRFVCPLPREGTCAAQAKWAFKSYSSSYSATGQFDKSLKNNAAQGRQVPFAGNRLTIPRPLDSSKTKSFIGDNWYQGDLIMKRSA